MNWQDVNPAHRRELVQGEACSVRIFDVATCRLSEIWRSTELLLEAPNWVDADTLILNGEGMLWRLAIHSGALSPVHAPDLPPLNNDHVLAPDGETMFVSGFDWHIHELSLRTGESRRITGGGPTQSLLHFLHGISPAGDELAFTGIPLDDSGLPGPASIFSLSLADGAIRQLTWGSSHDDGCEYSPDGHWIYCNTEAFAACAGHAQIARLPRSGGDLEQLTFDQKVNWFPHFAPDGNFACYLSYPAGTSGHPAGLPVELRLVEGGNWSNASVIAAFRGGQGTINVNSWAPGGQALAFVAYPLADALKFRR